MHCCNTFTNIWEIKALHVTKSFVERALPAGEKNSQNKVGRLGLCKHHTARAAERAGAAWKRLHARESLPWGQLCIASGFGLGSAVH